MRRSFSGSGARLMAAIVMMSAVDAAAEGLTIEHEPLRCVVAGRRSTIRACFEPGREIAAARIHYRRDARPAYTPVAMRADGACFAGVVPAFPRALSGGKVHYYIEGVDRSSAAVRTTAYAPILVARGLDCEDGGAAARRRVSPALIAGGVAAAGVAGGLALAGSSSVPSTTTLPRQPPPVRESPTAPSTPPPAAGGALSVTCQANPRSGIAPLRVDFAAFPTGATGIYLYEWSFGDGGASNNPAPSHTYGAGRFEAVVRVTSGAEAAACTREITVTAPGGPNPTPTPAPTPTPTPTPIPTPTPTPTPTPPPPPIMRTLTATVGGNFPGSVASTPAGLSCITGQTCSASFVDGTSVTVTGSAFSLGSVFITGACTASGSGNASCTVVMNADRRVDVTIFRSSSQSEASRPEVAFATSQLDAPEATGHVTVDGGTAFAVGTGLTPMALPARAGTRRIEGVLTRGSGQPGTWRFDLGDGAGIRAGSLRVLAGTVLVITPHAVVFRLEGKPGERVAFTFAVDD